MDQKQYGERVKALTPTHNTAMNAAKAFLCGGLLCALGQALLWYFTEVSGLPDREAGTWMLIVLIGLSVLLTGFNLYTVVVKFAGAGILVPITGFANAVASPAIEYQKEGQVFGIGCKIFTIAGPVILYGVVVSWGLGVVYLVMKLFGAA